MATNVEWPASTDEPYTVTVEADTSDVQRADAADAQEFDRFENLTGKLLRVSKGELDEKLREK